MTYSSDAYGQPESSETPGYGASEQPGYNGQETELNSYNPVSEPAFGVGISPFHTDLIRNSYQSNPYDPYNLGDSPFLETLTNSSPTISSYGSEPSAQSLNGSYSNIDDSAELEL